MTPFYGLLAVNAAAGLTLAVLAWHGNLRLTLAARPERKPTVTGDKP